MHTGRNVCIAYGDARCYGVVELLECNHPRGTLKTPRRRSLAFYRFHTPFPYIRVHAKSFGTNVFLLCRYAFCTGRKRRRANNYAGIVWNLYEAYRFQLEFAVRQPSLPYGKHRVPVIKYSHITRTKDVSSLCAFIFSPKRSHL